MLSPRNVGIEAIAVHVPRHFLDLKTLAQAGGIAPEKYYFGLGGRRMAVAAPDEDSVTMAVEAARGALQRYDIDPGSIGMLVVGTETGVDAAKPVAAFVHGMLGLPASCRTFDAKHACYGATAGLRFATDWCRAGSAPGKKALVIATDIARYPVASPGEPTQGAGAVAMVVSDEPGVFELAPHPEAVFTRDVMDFWRPTYQSTALVDGKLSLDSYLEALDHTWTTYEASSGLGWDDYRYVLFHVPFPKMAFKAHHRVFERVVGEVEGGVTKEASFEQKTLPALWANRELGNVYSGSLYLSLAGLVESGGADVAGATVGLFSYGSGSCGEFFSGRVGADAEVWRGRVGITEGLEGRVELDHAGYLQMREAAEAMARDGSYRDVTDEGNAETGRAVFCGVRDHVRVYGYATEATAAAVGQATR